MTAERIRDKIAAFKAKGMWMGGIPPIGYLPETRQLIVVPEEAEIVRLIFHRFLGLGSVRRLQAELSSQGHRTPLRTSRKGRVSGGCIFSTGKLYKMLSNPVYIGRIRHREKIYPGQHQAIVDVDTWKKVQALLVSNRASHQRRTRAAHPSPLAGKLYDPDGQRMRPLHARKGARLYRYYVSPKLVEGSVETGATGWRLPAEEVETVLAKVVSDRLGDPELQSLLLGKMPARGRRTGCSDCPICTRSTG
ncbi:MAG: recombinase family protein [Rhodobacteraceae bacterium]|nr:recombinase family protein [Paracoccaceae bacterium]